MLKFYSDGLPSLRLVIFPNRQGLVYPHQSLTLPRELSKRLSTSREYKYNALVGTCRRCPSFGQTYVESIPSIPRACASLINFLRGPHDPWATRSSSISSCQYGDYHPENLLAHRLTLLPSTIPTSWDSKMLGFHPHLNGRLLRLLKLNPWLQFWATSYLTNKITRFFYY